jgi:two-component system, OmpR family, sensor histidine kinase MtrB
MAVTAARTAQGTELSPGLGRLTARRTPSGAPRSRPGRLGLRNRITIAFGLGSLLLSLMLALITFFTVRSTLIDQRQSNALAFAFQNAETISQNIQQTTADTDFAAVIGGLPRGFRSGQPLVVFEGTTYGAPRDSLPEPLIQAALQDPVQQVFSNDSGKQLGIGLPLSIDGAAYFEVVPLDDLDDALSSLRVTLIGASALTTAVGALTGRFVARRAVRPVAVAARAAEAIAGGQLDTRMETSDDRDLQVLATSFNDMAAALAARIERDARFASDVSHELRSPLMTLSASIEVLETRRHAMDERAAQALDLLTADVARFRTLVEDLLEISRFDVGSVKLQLDEVHVSEFVRQAVALAGYAEVPIKVDDDAVAGVVSVDKRRLARVLANLLDNARNYAGGATVVTVERVDDPLPARRADGDADAEGVVRIAVMDEGPGVPVEDRARIFERFNRGGEAGRRGGGGDGVGLGLALVDEHVKLHGGRVWVEDRHDAMRGARFVIELPVVAW